MWELDDYVAFTSQVKRIARKVKGGIPLSSQEDHLDSLFLSTMFRSTEEKLHIATWVLDDTRRHGDPPLITAILSEVLGLPAEDMIYEWEKGIRASLHGSPPPHTLTYLHHPLASQIREQTRRRIPGPYGHSTTKRRGRSSEFTDIRYEGRANPILPQSLRRNSDSNMRELERQAAQGDTIAIQKLRRMRERAHIRASGPRLAFEMVEVEAPWRGEGETVWVVNLENCMRQGPPSHQVPVLWNSNRIYWSKNYNSYVMVVPKDGDQGEFWHETEGQVDLYSVNGAGEIRWNISARDAESLPSGGFGGEGAAQAFGLL